MKLYDKTGKRLYEAEITLEAQKERARGDEAPTSPYGNEDHDQYTNDPRG